MPTTLIMPVDQGVHFIRAWADHDWPITREQAFTLRDELGWTPAEDDEEIFTTDLGLEPGEGDMSFRPGGLYMVNFELSSTAIDEPDMPARTRAAFSEYVDALTLQWGHPKQFTDRDVLTAEWTLPNGCQVSLRQLNRILSTYIESAEWQVTKAMARVDEINTGDA